MEISLVTLKVSFLSHYQEVTNLVYKKLLIFCDIIPNSYKIQVCLISHRFPLSTRENVFSFNFEWKSYFHFSLTLEIDVQYTKTSFTINFSKTHYLYFQTIRGIIYWDLTIFLAKYHNLFIFPLKSMLNHHWISIERLLVS